MNHEFFTRSSFSHTSLPFKQIIHVDFDFYAPKDIDYHACKRFLVHLFGLDAEQLHTELMVETLLKQTQLGTTVKVDGEESDPFALLTLLPLPTTTPVSFSLIHDSLSITLLVFQSFHFVSRVVNRNDCNPFGSIS